MVDCSDKRPVSWVAHQLDTHRDEFITELMAVTKAQIQVLDIDPRTVELLKASITENLVAGIHYLDLGGADTPVTAPATALAYARALAQRDVPLSALIRAYRIGHARFVDAAMGHTAGLPSAQRVPALIELVGRTAHWIDVICDQVGVVYEQERDRWVSRRSGLRQQWVGRLLDDTAIDIAQAEDVLRYRVDGVHLAAVVWADPEVSAREVVALFDQLQSRIAGELGALGHPLLVPTDEREARMWFAVRTGTVIDRTRLRAEIEAMDLRAQLVFGEPGVGLAGFRGSLRQAERVKVVVLAGGARLPNRVVFHADVAAVALLAGDMDGLRRFVAGTLGDLGTDDERTGWLRDTLREFLARNRSYVAAAGAMILHRNTIQYRVTQAVKLCRLDIDDPDAVLRVQIALEACRWMAPAVLRSPRTPVRPGR